jgi:ATP-binding cassette subfamily B protein
MTPASLPAVDDAVDGLEVALHGVSVRAAGHTILEDINLRVKAGSHVAVVGPSGAGKTSLVGLLLGWHRPASGTVEVNGQALSGDVLAGLRRHTAWVDPAVQLWNRSLLDNLRYGAGDSGAPSFQEVLERAGLYGVVERMPEGLQTLLGEGGGLVSGGEGQRVRLGRGLLRPAVRLAILDEPFRGLHRNERRHLLGEARRLWSGATMLCVTHDVGETVSFDHVVVVEAGRITEQGKPQDLLARTDGRYRQLVEAERKTREELWSGSRWRCLHLTDGQLQERIEGA